jgi:hypothetical protein
MTRAVVGGINPVDNEFYPLAVNSQGIAQIDTSGIPTPLSWTYSLWTPEYSSSDGGSAVIEYDVQSGVVYSLGAMSWFHFALRTSNVSITSSSGDLMVKRPPNSTLNYFGDQTKGNITKAKGFNLNPFPLMVSLYQNTSDEDWRIFKTTSSQDQQIESYVPFSALREGAIVGANELWGSGFFRNNTPLLRDGSPADL